MAVVIKNFPDYYIEPDGAIHSIKSDGRFGSKSGLSTLKAFTNKQGYLCVNLYDASYKMKQVKVHRLVAIHYLTNPLGLPQVNHIDGNKLNPHMDNLEWCTARQNIAHATINGLRDNECRKSQVKLISPDGNLYDVFGISEFARVHNLSKSCLSQLKNGALSQHKGWTLA